MSAALDDLRKQASTRNYSMHEAEQSTGLSNKTIHSILNGTNDNPTLETVELLAKFFCGEIVFRTGGEIPVETNGDVSYYRRLLAEKQDSLALKDKWIFRLFVVCLILIGTNIIIALCFSTI